MNKINSVRVMTEYEDTNPEHWEDYTNLQHVKHALLRRYLGGWFPKLSWVGRVVYIDTHAGRGQYKTGQMGSPLVALDVLLNHKARERILQQSEVIFLFIEADRRNKEILEANINALGKRPPKVKIKVECENYEKVVQDLLDEIREQHAELAPAFIFVDPYTFKLPMQLLQQLKAFTRCELFVNLMWRHINMAINNPAHERNVDILFGCPAWRQIRNIADPDQQCESAIQLFRESLGAKYVTWIKMLGKNEAIKYVLLHATNHPKGLELMKDALWAVCPEGVFEARISENPNQKFLFELGCELEPLRNWLRENYRNKDVPLDEIYSALNSTPYLPTHLNKVLKEFHKNGEIISPKTLIFKSHPKLRFGPNKT